MKTGDLRVWWIPQVPMESFYVDVKSVDEAVMILKTLANYDIFQFKNNIKPDYCNAGGLQIFNNKDDDPFGEEGWTVWCDEEGNDIDDIRRARFEES